MMKRYLLLAALVGGMVTGVQAKSCKSKTFRQLCVLGSINAGSLSVSGNVAVGGNETITGNLTVGGIITTPNDIIAPNVLPAFAYGDFTGNGVASVAPAAAFTLNSTTLAVGEALAANTVTLTAAGVYMAGYYVTADVTLTAVLQVALSLNTATLANSVTAVSSNGVSGADLTAVGSQIIFSAPAGATIQLINVGASAVTPTLNEAGLSAGLRIIRIA